MSNSTMLKASGYEIKCPPMLPVSDWYLYLAPSIGIYFGGLLILIVYNGLYWTWWESRSETCQESEKTLLERCAGSPVKDWLDECALGINFAGRFLQGVIILLSLASFVLYLLDASNTAHGVPIEYCITWSQAPFIQADFAFNIVFLFYFLFRLFASFDKLLLFWINWQTIVDIATVPTSFTYLAYDRYWPALRFFRIIYFMMIPDLAERSGILKNSMHIRLATLGAQFVAFWFVSAGFVHLLENSGDPWMARFDGQTLAYWQCVYFMIVTGSTIGYGDVTCKTVLGQVFDCFYIFFGLAMFANALPEVLNIMQIASPYRGRFRLPKGKRLAIICGHVESEAASKFIDSFLHPDWDSKNLIALFINPKMPDLEFEALIKRQPNTFYICGSEMNSRDLERAAASYADVFIILANHLAEDPDDEDSANIMRAVSIKNLYGHKRILMQLLLEQNKPNLLNVPNWGPLDASICLDEFKMGMLAANCWAPGFSTLLSLLLTQLDNSLFTGELDTEGAYLHGATLEIYENELSPDFAEMAFAEVVALCFVRLNIVLFAIGSGSRTILCPAPEHLIQSADRGFFITSTFECSERAFYFCKKCHLNVKEPEKISRCKCRASNIRKSYSSSFTNLSIENDNNHIRLQQLLRSEAYKDGNVDGDLEIEVGGRTTQQTTSWPMVLSKAFARQRKAHTTRGPAIAEEKFDFTGMFYWNPPRKFEEAQLSLEDARRMHLEKHVVLCVFGEASSQRIGLRNFVMPLRSSNRHPEELLPIVIVGSAGYVLSEWANINMFPGIYVIGESPMNRNALRACNVEKCKMCVIVSARRSESDSILMDKRAILCYLNIRSMKFDSSSALADGNGVSAASSARSGLQRLPSLQRTPVKTFQEPLDITAASSGSATNYVNSIPIIADVVMPENVLILDDDSSHTTSTPLQLTNPFACGNVFAGDVLNNATSAAYYSPRTLDLVREILTGGSTNESENMLAEGLGFMEGHDEELIKRNRCRARVSNFSVVDPKYMPYIRFPCTFSSLFMRILEEFGYVCLGLSRLKHADSCEDSDEAKHRRIVILRPPDQLFIEKSDVVLCLKPFFTNRGVAESQNRTLL